MAPRNVVLLTIDSLRADHCGFMGHDGETTPTLDGLARDGLVFENAIAPAAATNGSVPTMLTGHYPDPGLTSEDDYGERMRQHMRARPTIARRFTRRGYTTAAFTANPWTSRYYGFDSDFDHFEDFMDESLSRGLVASGRPRRGLLGEAAANLLNWYQGQDMFMDWERLLAAVEAWLETAPEPYFLWIFLVDPHMPYLPPPRYRSRSPLLTYPANAALFAGRHELRFERLWRRALLAAYDDSIRYTDDGIERLVELVDGDAVVTVTADHGECFGEDGVYGHGPTLSEALVHVPLVVANGPSGRVSEPLSLRSLPQLQLALAAGQDGRSLTRPAVFARNYDPALLVRGRRFRYRWRPESTALSVRNGDGWTDGDDPELAALGQRLVDGYVAGEAERERLVEAARTVGAEQVV